MASKWTFDSVRLFTHGATAINVPAFVFMLPCGLKCDLCRMNACLVKATPALLSIGGFVLEKRE
jgi:hypothetical protein